MFDWIQNQWFIGKGVGILGVYSVRISDKKKKKCDDTMILHSYMGDGYVFYFNRIVDTKQSIKSYTNLLQIIYLVY